jgi:DNA-binding transcriptional LysR family regulator
MKFTLAQVQAFASIVEAGSFHGAARRLHLTQPTVSQRIRELEDGLGAALFVRNGSRFHLSAEGHALVDYARRLLGTAGELGAHFSGRDPLKGTIRLGVPNLFAIFCMTDLLRTLAERFGGLKASVRLNDSPTLSQMLEEQELDIAILVEPSVSARVRQVSVGRTTYGWMASPQLSLPTVLRPRDLSDMHVMVSPPPSRLHAMVMSWFSAAGATPTRLSTCNNFAVTIETVASGLAIAVLPLRSMKMKSASGRLRQLSVKPSLPSHAMSICYQTGALGPGLEAVATLMRDLIKKHKLFDE